MKYLDQKTLEFFIFLLYKDTKFGVNLDLFNTEIIDRVLEDITRHKLEKAFFFILNIDIKKHSDKIDDLKEFHKKVHENYKAHSENFIIPNLIYNAISEPDFMAPFDFEDFKKIKNIYWKPILYQFFTLNLLKPEVKILSGFLKKYINEFKNDELILNGAKNYYKFNKNLSRFVEIFDIYYEEYGKSFNVSRLRNNEGRSYLLEKEFRLYDLILYLVHEGSITINNCDFSRIDNQEIGEKDITEKCILNINLTFKKQPSEIQDIEKYWTYYGDIRLNEKDGIAFYKKNRYPFKSTKGRAFMLLCKLVKNHGKKILIEDIYDSIAESDKKDKIKNLTLKKKKSKISGYRKEIVENLHILDDEKPTINISITGKYIMLISNPLIN